MYICSLCDLECMLNKLQAHLVWRYEVYLVCTCDVWNDNWASFLHLFLHDDISKWYWALCDFCVTAAFAVVVVVQQQMSLYKKLSVTSLKAFVDHSRLSVVDVWFDSLVCLQLSTLGCVIVPQIYTDEFLFSKISHTAAEQADTGITFYDRRIFNHKQTKAFWNMLNQWQRTLSNI